MRRFFSSSGFKIFTVVVAALLAGTIAAAFSHHKTTPATSVTSAVFGPLQRFSAYISDGLSKYSINFKSSASLSEENKKLEKEIEDLRQQLVKYEQTKQLLDLYKKSLGLKDENPGFQFLSAAVVGRDALTPFRSFTLNQGSENKVSINDPVIYGDCLVGKVISVMPTRCVVQTILDPAFNAGVYEIRSHEEGFITTTGALSAKGFCRLTQLDKATEITPGGMVSTSGVGGLFPRDLFVGTVKEVLDETADISCYAVIEPGVDIGELDYVLILTDFKGKLDAAPAGE